MMRSDETDEKVDTRFKAGAEWAGNRSGRPKGARSKLGEQFVQDLYASWRARGAEVIEKVINDRPQDYLKVIAGILPKEVHVNSTALNELADDELAGLLTLAQSIAGAGAAQGARSREDQESHGKPAAGVRTIQ